MRVRQLLTVDPDPLRVQADRLGGRIDHFLIQREQSVLSKLVAIGGVAQGRSFEVQVKVQGVYLEKLEAQLLGLPEVHLLRGSERSQYDTYFLFDDRWGTRLRYREDEVRDLESGEIVDLIYRLTLTNMAKEREFENSILLSRSRFDAPATRSLRFYQEYFKPDEIVEVRKLRRRFHIRYGNTDFAVNFDRIGSAEMSGAAAGARDDHPFLEIKSRTWSQQDAQRKAGLISDLLALLELPAHVLVKVEYLDVVRGKVGGL